jgi:alpha-soluble NSF attachment protein
MDVRFPDSRECKLLENLIQAIENKDVKAFRTALKEYDSISKLDAWKTAVFLVIKNNLEKELKEPTLNLR